MKRMKALGFQRTMYDEDELRTSGRKENPEITFSSTQFHKTWDRLDVQVLAAASGTTLTVLPVTEAEYFGQNGKYFQALRPSEEVVQAGEKLQRDCATEPATPADTVPSGARP